jgi:hypothetical protein
MTHKVSVTYKAPPGDSKVCEMYGHTFYDGKAEEVEVDDETLAKLQGSRVFECGKPTEVKDQPKTTSDAERKAADAKALADENAKLAAQGLPPLEDPQHPKSGEGHPKSGEHGKEANEAHGKAKA